MKRSTFMSMRSGHRPPHQGGLPRVPVEVVGGDQIWAPPFMRKVHDKPLHAATPATRVLHLVPDLTTPMPPTSD